MAGKRISAAKAKKLEDAGFRPIEGKKAPDPAPIDPRIDEALAQAKAATKAAEITEQAFKALAESNDRQKEALEQLIARIPQQEGAPPITGLKLHKNGDGWTTYIELVRGDKKKLN